MRTVQVSTDWTGSVPHGGDPAKLSTVSPHVYRYELAVDGLSGVEPDWFSLVASSYDAEIRVTARPDSDYWEIRFSKNVSTGYYATYDRGFGPENVTPNVPLFLLKTTAFALSLTAYDYYYSGTITVPGAPPAPSTTVSGNLEAPAAGVSGAGDIPESASGAVTAQAANAGGTGTMAVGGGAVAAGAAVVVGGGDQPLTGSGDVTARAAYALGTAVAQSGTGAPAAPAATVAGTGTLGDLLPGYIRVSPKSVALAPGETQQFSVVGSGGSSPPVVWSCSRGSITPGGLFTAPDVGAAITVTARSVADPTKSDMSTVTISTPTSTRRLVFRRKGWPA